MAVAVVRGVASRALRMSRVYHEAARVLAGSARMHTSQSADGCRTGSYTVFPFRTRISPASKARFRVRCMSSDITELPKLSDPAANAALNALLATNWSKIEKDVTDVVENALAKGADGILSTCWSSALAVEKFADTLTYLRMELDELSGAGGENVGRMPEALLRALNSAINKYQTYLESFGEHEEFLKRKVEHELGGIFVQIKMRCSGLGPEWGKIALIGTSGLSGSYIERRT